MKVIQVGLNNEIGLLVGGAGGGGGSRGGFTGIN